MPLLTQLPDLLVSALLIVTTLSAFYLSGLLDEDDDVGESWGDDPQVLAVLSGMSL